MEEEKYSDCGTGWIVEKRRKREINLAKKLLEEYDKLDEKTLPIDKLNVLKEKHQALKEWLEKALKNNYYADKLEMTKRMKDFEEALKPIHDKN